MDWRKSLSFCKPKRVVSIATDCSGIEAPVHTLKVMNIDYDHVFSSESNRTCRELIKSVYKPKVLYKNIFSRSFSDGVASSDEVTLPIEKVDIYVCGFPCQSFSIIGKQLGFEDSRGVVFFECLKTISVLKPRVFILENVKHLVNHDSGKTFKTILQSLEELGIYNIYWKVLNTKEFGIPQNRPRVYIVGVLKTFDNGFLFPKPINIETKIDDFLQKEDLPVSTLTEKQSIVLEQRMSNKSQDGNYVVNVGCSTKGGFGSAMKDISPCLLSGSRRYYSTRKKRFLTVTEWALLQGFDPEYIDFDLLNYKQLGNTMSVNVLAFLFQNIFNHVSF